MYCSKIISDIEVLIRTGQEDALLSLLAQDNNLLEIVLPKRRNLLHLAVECQLPSIVTLLLRQDRERFENNLSLLPLIFRGDYIGSPPIFYAAHDDNIVIFQILLSHYPTGYKTAKGIGIAHTVFAQGSLLCAKHLMQQQQINFLEKDSLGDTCVHLAVANNHLPVIDFLIQQRTSETTAALRQTNIAGQNSFLIAAADETASCDMMWKIAQHLIVSEYSCVDNRGNTAAHLAAQAQNLHKLILAILLYPEAVDVRNNAEESLFDLMSTIGFKSGLDFLKKYQDIQQNDEYDPIDKIFIIYQRALFDHDFSYFPDNMLRTLLRQSEENALDINPQDASTSIIETEDDRQTILHMATIGHATSLVSRICSMAPHLVDRVDSDHNTALHLAIKNNCSAELTCILIRQTNRPNIADYDKNTALHLACQQGFLDIVQQLLEHPNINIDATDDNDDTPAHLSISIDDNEAVTRALIEAGADLTIEGSEKCVLFTLIEQNDIELLEHIFIHAPHTFDYEYDAGDDENSLHIAIMNGSNLETIEFLCSRVPSLISRTTRNRTVIHLAIERGDIRILEVLLNHQSPEHPVDFVSEYLPDEGDILDYVVTQRRFDMMQLIIDRVPGIVAALGWHAAIAIAHQDNVSAFLMLLGAGFDIHQFDEDEVSFFSRVLSERARCISQLLLGEHPDFAFQIINNHPILDDAFRFGLHDVADVIMNIAGKPATEHFANLQKAVLISNSSDISNLVINRFPELIDYINPINNRNFLHEAVEYLMYHYWIQGYSAIDSLIIPYLLTVNDIFRLDNDGLSPIMLTINQHNQNVPMHVRTQQAVDIGLSILKKMIKANPDIMTNINESALPLLRYARAQHNTGALNLLLDAIQEPLLMARSPDMLRSVIQEFPELLTFRSEDTGNTLLHRAISHEIYHGNDQVSEMFFSLMRHYPLELMMPNTGGLTPLLMTINPPLRPTQELPSNPVLRQYYDSQNKHRGALILRLIIQLYPENLTHIVDNGGTLLHYAAIHQNAACLAVLLNTGASKEARNNAGLTALDIVRQSNRADLEALFDNNHTPESSEGYKTRKKQRMI